MPNEIILIAAVTVDGFIARHKLEEIKWSKDLSLFKKQTDGHCVIVGHNTHQTLSKHLLGRKVVIVGRSYDPQKVLSNIKLKKCFIIGGGKTYHCFFPFITDLYITPHPNIFGSGIPLFNGCPVPEANLKFIRMVVHDNRNGVFQYQYKILRK